MNIKNVNEFEKAMIRALSDSKLVTHVNLQDVTQKFDEAIIYKMMDESCPLIFEDNTIVFKNNGEELRCPNYGANIQLDAEWLSEKLSDVSYDIDQGGNVRKADEAEAALCCVNIAKVLNDKSIRSDIANICAKYDFTKCSINDIDESIEYSSFCDLLDSLRSLQSRQINVIISATKISIINFKKDTSKYLRDGIPKDLVIDLRSLETNIKTEFRTYSTGALSPERVRKLTKLEILELIDKRDRAIELLIDNSKAGVLFRILSLTSEYLGPLDKRKLNTEARNNVNKLFQANSSLYEVLGDESQVTETWKKRYYKIATNSFIKEQVELYLESPVAYILPVKR